MSSVRKRLLQAKKWTQNITKRSKKIPLASWGFIMTGLIIFLSSILWFTSKFQPVETIDLENVTGSQILHSPKSRVDMQIAQTEILPSCSETASNCIYVVMEIQQIDYVEHKINGVLRVTIPDVILWGLVDSEGKNIIYNVQDSLGYNNRAFRDPKIADKNISFRARYNLYEYSKNFFITVPISLGEIVNAINEDPYYRFYETSIPFNVEIMGDSASYPHDKYLIDLTTWFFTPDGIYYGTPEKDSDGTLIPFGMFVSLSPNMPEKIAKVYTRDGTKPAVISVGNYQYIGIELYRDSSSLIYVYGMSFIPILLTLLLSHRLFINKRLNKSPEDNLLLEVAAVFLSILPLRTVLVPAEIQTTTRVDYILAFSVTLLVSIVLVRYGIQ